MSARPAPLTKEAIAEAKKRAGAAGEGVEIQFLLMVCASDFTGDSKATQKRFDSETIPQALLDEHRRCTTLCRTILSENDPGNSGGAINTR